MNAIASSSTVMVSSNSNSSVICSNNTSKKRSGLFSFWIFISNNFNSIVSNCQKKFFFSVIYKFKQFHKFNYHFVELLFLFAKSHNMQILYLFFQSIANIFHIRKKLLKKMLEIPIEIVFNESIIDHNNKKL